MDHVSRYNAPAGHEARDAEGDDPKVQIKGPKEQQYIGVGQFAQTLYSIRDQWPEREKDVGMGDRGVEREGLVLFAGDVFNPSVESAITRGSHMVPILRELKLDASCVGKFPHILLFCQVQAEFS
jgi:5'-nucleotidase